MPTEYISQAKKVQQLIDELKSKGINEIERARIDMLALRKHGASKGTVDKVIKTFTEVGEISVSDGVVTLNDEAEADEEDE